MKFSSLDYSKLETSLESNQNKTYKLADVQHRLVKVAFDVVRFMDGDDVKSLWKIEKNQDGEYIVANYQSDDASVKLADSELTKSASVDGDWKVIVNKALAEVQLFYKSNPVVKLSSVQLGLPKEELDLVNSYLPSKLSKDKDFTRKIIKLASEEYQQELLNKYPELS